MTETFSEVISPGRRMRQTRATSEIRGLLTQSILPSPVIQWILPARLRSKHHNDVVFVGEKRVQVKEAVAGGHLEDVIEKTDFDGSIIGAKVINVSTQLPWEAQLQSGGGWGEMDVDQELLDNLPPQILLLSLDMKELLFLSYSNLTESRLVTYHRPLPGDVSLPEKFGRHIAVDPKSRGVAVAASNDYFGVFWLRSPRDLQLQMAKGQLDPISKEHFHMVGGDILFMEFLYPKTADDKKIILLLIVAKDEVTNMVTYEWEEKESMRHSVPKVSEVKLQQQDRLPTMIVPLTKESSFLLITTTSMAIYPSDLSVRPARYPIIAPDTEPCRAGLWTRWARPLRNWLYSQKYDGIYLCREDGWIYYLEFGNEDGLETQTSLGQLHCDVDTAFDVLDMGHEGGDFILAAGSMGDGGLFIQEARDHPRCVQRFLNWAPVTDAVIIPSETQSSLEGDVAHDRLFVCSASTSGRGALTEIRYGIEAQIGVAVALDELSSIRDMWTMADDVNGGVYVMISHPLSSLLLYMASDLEDGINALDERDTGLDTAQTLAAGCTSSGIIVQVTEKATHLFVTHSPSANICVRHEPHHTAIAVAVDGPTSTVVTAMRGENDMSLRLTRIVEHDNTVHLSNVGNPVKIDKEPICLSLQTFGDTSFIFMGTGDGVVMVFHVENETIMHLFDVAISIDTEDDISKAIETLAAIRTTANGSLQALLFCGLRSGILVPFEIDFNAISLIGLRQKEPRQLGKTSIRLQSKDTFALFTCGDELWRVSYAQDSSPLDYFLWRIWITDQNNPAYFPITLSGFSLINTPSSNSGSPLGPLFCFADSQLLICTLDQEAKAVPRRIDLPGNASKLTFSKYLRSLIVSYTITEAEDPENPFDRITRPYIEFVDPDSQCAVAHQNRSSMEEGTEPWRPQGAAGEKITCIFDWMPQRDGNEYHLIAIGTSRPQRPDENQNRGRVFLLQASRDPSHPSRIDCMDKHMQLVRDPVHAMASFGDSLIVAAGKSVFPMTSRRSSTRWVRDATVLLHSPVVAITVHGQHLYITTSRNSSMVYEVVDGALVPRAWDSAERDGLSHIFVPGEPSLTFVSSRGGTVRMFPELGGTSSSSRHLPPALSEAHLPVSMLRLVSGSRVSPLSPTRGVVYGFALNGAVYRFLALEKGEWRLLRLLQNLCRKDSSICPSLPARQRRFHPAALDATDNKGHIDGDVLVRLLDRGADYLQQIITAYDSSPRASSGALALERSFCEMSHAVLGVSSNHAEVVMGWLRKLLHVEI